MKHDFFEHGFPSFRREHQLKSSLLRSTLNELVIRVNTYSAIPCWRIGCCADVSCAAGVLDIPWGTGSQLLLWSSLRASAFSIVEIWVRLRWCFKRCHCSWFWFPVYILWTGRDVLCVVAIPSHMNPQGKELWTWSYSTTIFPSWSIYKGAHVFG